MSDTIPREAVARLDNAIVMSVLGHLTVEIRRDLPASEQSRVQSLDEARQALAALIETDADPNSLVDEANAEATGRKLLNVLAEEPATWDRARDLIAEPPEDLQRSIAAAAAAAVVVGALISWLQTEVDIEVTREGSQTNFRFHMRKDRSDSKLIGDVVATVRRILLF